MRIYLRKKCVQDQGILKKKVLYMYCYDAWKIVVQVAYLSQS